MLKPEEISGSKCPFCGGKDAVYWGEVTIEDDTAQQRGTCADCDESWVAIYDFVGVAFDPEGHPEPNDRIIAGTPQEQYLEVLSKELQAYTEKLENEIAELKKRLDASAN